jgi:hypothetical protein
VRAALGIDAATEFTSAIDADREGFEHCEGAGHEVHLTKECKAGV